MPPESYEQWLEDVAGDLRREMAETVPELMGAAEAARELGVKSSNLRKTAGLPKPVQQLKSGPLWLASEIRALAQARRG